MALGLALALSSTALVLPISGTDRPVGKTAFAMLLFEDLALVPMLFLIELDRRPWRTWRVRAHGAASGCLSSRAMLVVGRVALAALFAQAARTKNPELFLAISLLTVILASLATALVGLSPILGALIAGILIAETDYHAEVEAITAPLAGLALGIFLITVGMRIDLELPGAGMAADPRRNCRGPAREGRDHLGACPRLGRTARRRGRNRRDDGEPVGDQPDRARRCGRSAACCPRPKPASGRP